MEHKKSALNLALAAEIRAERTAQSIPVTELAKQARMVLGTLYRVLSGERDISMTQLGSIALALQVTPEELMSRAVRRMGGLQALFDAVDADPESEGASATPSTGDLPVPHTVPQT